MEQFLQSVFKLVLPAGLEQYFDLREVKELCDVKNRRIYYELHLEEHNELRSVVDGHNYESKDLTELRVQDFPLRGKDVFLVIRRRRWRRKDDPSKIVRNDYNYIAEGCNLTKELADFLKGTGRYERRYDQ